LSLTEEDRLAKLKQRYDDIRREPTGLSNRPDQRIAGSPGRQLPWEYMRDLFRAVEFDDLSDAEQRDELLAAIGLWVEWGSANLPSLDKDDEEFPGMNAAVRYMGDRYGPWRR
jgi:hypothetical protein